LHLHGLPVSASGNSWSYRVGKFVKRHKGGVAATALVAVILIASTAISASLAQQASGQKEVATQLVALMLGDFDTALRTGSTSARKVSLDHVLENLNQLSRGSADDPKLRALLFRAYMKVGEVEGNLFESNLGDAAAAKQSYQHAAALAAPPDETAEASIGLGDMDLNGDSRAALAQYEKAESVLAQAVHQGPPDEKRGLNLARIRYKKSVAQMLLGSLPEALETRRNELRFSEQLAPAFPSSLDVRREVALAEEHVGRALESTGDVSGALPHLKRSLEVYLELLKLAPERADFRRDEALGVLAIAEATYRLGDLSTAAEDYRQGLASLEKLVTEDPQNVVYQRDRNSILQDYVGVLYEQGKLAESRRLAERALAVLQPLIAKSEPSFLDLHQYCWDLLNTPFQDLRRPREALAVAQKAADLTQHNDPSILNLLALAWAANGDLQQAIATEEQALAKSGPGVKRTEIESHLDRFQKRAASRPPRKN